MTKKKAFWIIFSLLLLALLLLLGRYLTENRQNVEEPPVVEATEPSFETEPSSSEEESVPEESSSEDISQPSEDTQGTEPSQSTAEEPSSQQPPTEAPQPPTAPPTTPPTSEEGEDLQARIDALIAEVYALRDYYTAQLAYVESSARAEYEALPPEERSPERKQEIALACIDQVYALENECDSRMDAICNELAYLLLEIDGDLTLVNEIRYAYAREKEIAKSEFIEKYADYFG